VSASFSTPSPSAHTTDVIDTLSYVSRFAGQKLLIKLGGAALQDSTLVESICDDFARMQSIGVSLVLVHGGGPSINEELTTHGIKWEFIEGQRVTTPQMMDIVEMVLRGQVNSRLVRTLNRAGLRAVGISGADAQMLQCRPSDPRLGQVGTIEKIDASYVQSLLNSQHSNGVANQNGYVPVIAPTGVGKEGEAFNINADWAACHIAVALGIQKVLFLTDQDGILDGKGQLISELDAAELENLIEVGVIKGGMLAKARTMLHALKHGVKDIHVLNARRPHGLIEELFTSGGVGTVCRLRSLTAKKGEVEKVDHAQV
jgi:acetylglutamate kinase